METAARDQLAEDIDWLRQLDDMVRHHGRHPFCMPEKRSLLPSELTNVFEIVLRHNLPVVLHNNNTGIAMSIHEIPPKAQCPGIRAKDLRPKTVLFLTQHHLPLSEAKKLDDRTTFDDGWRVFSQLSHRDGNTEMCKSCGLDEPKDKSHYVY